MEIMSEAHPQQDKLEYSDEQTEIARSRWKSVEKARIIVVWVFEM